MNLTFLTEEQKNLLNNIYKKTFITGLNIVGSTILFIIISFFINIEKQPIQNLAYRYYFLGAALIIAFLIRIFKRLLLTKQQNYTFIQLLKRLQTSSIITFSLCDLVAKIGIIEYLMFGITMDLYLMIFLSFVFYVVHFPRKYQWEEYINLHIKEFK